MRVNEIQRKLERPFPLNRLRWRVGATNQRNGPKHDNGKPTKGIALAYIDARDVMRRLDEAVGPFGWQTKRARVAEGVITVPLGICVDDQWLWRCDGAGKTDVEGEKGGVSDALKRSAVLWGIGRYLYSLPNVWVELDQYGKFTPPNVPTWATPEGWDEIMNKREEASE